MEKELAIKYIEDAIAHRTTHLHYDKTIDLAKRYTAFVTGEGIDVELKQFNQRESDDEFNQRKLLTQFTLPCIINRVMQPINKIKKVQPTVKSLIVDKENDSTNIISKNIAKYVDGLPLDYNIKKLVIEYCNKDPNAFAINTFVDYNGETIMTTTVAKSENVINYKKDIKGNYIWVLCRYDVTKDVFENGRLKISKGNEYILYTKDYEIVYSEAAQGKEVGNRRYIVSEYDHVDGQLMAFPLGVINTGDYYLPFIHVAEPLLIKAINQISECDLTRRLHVFPKEYEYVPLCNDSDCIKGKNRSTGDSCKTCGGTGLVTHKSSQDKVTLPMPKDPSQIFDLTKVNKYAELPIEVFKMMFDLMDKIESDIIKAVYNKNIFENNVFNKTATESLIDQQSVFDAVVNFTSKIESIYKSSVTGYFNHFSESVYVEYSYPYNVNLTSYEALIGLLSDAKNANASIDVTNKINDMIEQSLFADDTEELTRIRTKRYFNPFAGKSESEVINSLSSNLVSELDKAVYLNLEQIFIDAELMNENFYLFTKEKQKIIILELASKYLPDVKLPTNEFTGTL